jgi:hypothetical protein
MTDGDDDPEALEDALHFVNNEIEHMGLSKVRVAVFTDAPPHSPEECPCGYDFFKEIKKMKVHGTKIEIIGCKGNTKNFGDGFFDDLPTTTLSEHVW